MASLPSTPVEVVARVTEGVQEAQVALQALVEATATRAREACTPRLKRVVQLTPRALNTLHRTARATVRQLLGP